MYHLQAAVRSAFEAAAVNLAPVGLSGYGLGQRQYDLAAVERSGDTLAHRAYALVQGGNVASGGEVFVDECDPILLACGGGGISRGVAQSCAAVYLEKEEAVEEPFGRFAVGGDVVGKLLGIPFDCAVFAAVVYKDKVADGCATDL